MDETIARAWLVFDSLKHVEESLICSGSEFICEICGGQKVIVDLPTCSECGRVDESYISEEPEWKSGADTDVDPSRVGAPVNTDHFSEAWGRTTYMTVARSASWAQKKLARINLHSCMNHKDRALFHAYAQLDKVGKDTLNLPEVVMYSAKVKYKAFTESVLTRGAVRNGIKANCIFQACRESGVARTTREIAEAFGIPPRDISRTFEMYQEQIPESIVHVTTPSDLISRLFNSIRNIPDGERGRIKMKVVKECKKLEEHVELMGRTPKAIACAVLARVLKDISGAPSRSELCKICEISVPTLGKIEAILSNLKES